LVYDTVATPLYQLGKPPGEPLTVRAGCHAGSSLSAVCGQFTGQALEVHAVGDAPLCYSSDAKGIVWTQVANPLPEDHHAIAALYSLPTADGAAPMLWALGQVRDG
jgi:hypothetical protein